MGVVVYLLPMAPDEDAETTVARTFNDGPAIQPWDPPDGWSNHCVEAIAQLYEWNRDEVDGDICFWHPSVQWQVEFDPSGITFRKRNGEIPSDLSPAELIRPFCGLPAVLYYDDEVWWTVPATPNDVADDVTMFG